ncbi:uncharacterized protein LOC144105757 [Amblyomma americanum]
MPLEKRQKLFVSTRAYREKHGNPYPRHEPASCPSLMARGFRFHAWLCRLCGCFFVRNLFGSERGHPPRVVWWSWYAFYSVGSLCFLLWMLVGAVMHAVRRSARNHYRFDGSLHVIAISVLSVKVLANITSLVAGSSKALAFYVRAAEFERRIGIPACACCSPRRYFWSDLRRGCLLVVYCIAFAAAVPLTPQSNIYVDHTHRPIWKQVCIWLRIILLIVFYFVYDNIHIAALRAAGEVLLEYMKNQLKVLESCTSQASVFQHFPPNSRNALKRLESIRLNFCEILDLKSAVNQVWNWSLVISTACTLLVVCTSAYEVCKNGPANWENYQAFLYSMYITYEFVALAAVSQSLIEAATKMKQACKTACTAVDVMQNQIQYLHDCIDPGELGLTGGAFFKLDMSLLVSAAAAIITYTVILVQTSRSSVDGFLYNSTRLPDVSSPA